MTDLNKLIDRKEAVTLLFFMVIPQLLVDYISYGISRHGSGYWINFIICSFFSFLLLYLIKKSFNKKLNVYVENSITEKIIRFIFVFYIISLTLYNFNVCSNATLSVTSKAFTKDIVLFLPIISAVICSVLGIEAISRLSYVIFYFTIGIVLFICFVTMKGWQVDNIYPIFGASKKTTFFDFTSCGMFLPLFSVYLIRENLSEPGKTFKLIQKALLYVFIFGLLLLVICILSVPHPMINFYDFSLAAIFSAAKSSVFFHRFELLLVFLLMVINTMSLSVGLYITSELFSDITKSNDTRPYSALVGCLLFYISLTVTDLNMIFRFYICSSLLLYVFFIIKSCLLNVRHKNRKRLKH